MECVHIPKIRIPYLLRRLVEKSGGRLPYSGAIEPTWRCNNNCVHCYCNLPANDPEAKKKEMSLEEMRPIIDELAEEGCLWLLFTGGEPFLRGDFLDIYSYTKKRGIWVSLYTNGTLITPRIADFLKKWPPRSVEITLYGATKETYENVTRVPGSFERCMQGIKLLLERKVRVALKMMVVSINKHELDKVRRLVKEEFGLRFRFDPIVHSRIDRSKDNLHLRLPVEEIVEFELEDRDRLKAYREKLIRMLGPHHLEFLYYCGAGRGTFQINPYGELGSCALLRRPHYNLRQGSFKEGWYEVLPRMLEQRRTKATKCDECELINFCFGCPASSFLETGDPEEPVDYFCEIAHLKWEGLRKYLKIN